MVRYGVAGTPDIIRMELETSLILIISILSISSFVRSAFGFGDALVAMPLLVLVTELRVATPLVALIGLTIALIILSSQWQAFSLRGVWRLILATFIGIPFGLILIQFAPEKLAKLFLGILLILYSFYGLFGFKLPHLKNEKLAGIFGLIAGILGGGYNTNGPPIIIYGTLRRWSSDYYRINLQGYFLVTNCLIAASHGMAGLWTWQVIQAYFYALPGAILGILLGNRLSKRISARVFEKAIYGLLFLIGMVFVWR